MQSLHDIPAPGTTSRRKAWAALGGGALVAAAGVAGVARWQSAPGGPTRRPGAGDRIPDVPMLTHEGRKVRFHSDLVKDRVVLVSMFYAQCSDRCPPMTHSLRRVQEMLGPRVGRDLFMYSISLTPEFDRPPDLRAYMKQYGVGPGWTFLTGDKADVEQLRVALGFWDVDPKSDADLGQHIGMVRIGNDALDRWCMSPLLQEPHLILEGLMAVDPVSRARGRTWPVPVES